MDDNDALFFSNNDASVEYQRETFISAEITNKKNSYRQVYSSPNLFIRQNVKKSWFFLSYVPRFKNLVDLHIGHTHCTRYVTLCLLYSQYILMYITRRVYISVGLNCTPAGITFSHVFYNIDADDSVDPKYFIYVSTRGK